MEIKTLKDLRDFVDSLATYSDDTKLIFCNNFQEFSISDDYIYSCNSESEIIEVNCELKGSILKGQHRVLGKMD